MIPRRGFVSGVILSAISPPLAARAQPPPGHPWRIGILMNLYSPDAPPPQALRQRLRELGYVEGQNLVIDWRYQLGQDDHLSTFATELVRLTPDVMVADVTVAIRAAMRATSTIPIVMASSADAAGGRLVASLGHPGGNVTGATIMLADLTPEAFAASQGSGAECLACSGPVGARHPLASRAAEADRGRRAGTRAPPDRHGGAESGRSRCPREDDEGSRRRCVCESHDDARRRTPARRVRCEEPAAHDVHGSRPCGGRRADVVRVEFH
jgi:hypothetical protein